MCGNKSVVLYHMKYRACKYYHKGVHVVVDHRQPVLMSKVNTVSALLNRYYNVCALIIVQSKCLKCNGSNTHFKYVLKVKQAV